MQGWNNWSPNGTGASGGLVEFGLHTKASAGNSASFAHLDSVELTALGSSTGVALTTADGPLRRRAVTIAAALRFEVD